MKQATHLRRGNQILEIGSGDIKNFPSISLARKASLALQMKLDGNRGLGSVQKVDKFPKREQI